MESSKLKLLTVSIAAYNVEKYLEKCLNSLNDDRFKDDIEVLIIDDGSKDNTKKIAEEFQRKSPDTFHYIPKKNGGHGSTINKGIELATGKYFRVIDGDDWVDKNNFYRYIAKLKRCDSDMILTKHKEVAPTKEKVISLINNMKDGNEYKLEESLEIDRVTLHMLTVRTSLLQKNKVEITENCFYVDVEYVIWAIFLSKTVTFYNLSVYMYRVGNINQSVSKKNMVKNVEMQEKVSYKLIFLYDKFLETKEIGENKKRVIYRTMKKSVGSTMRTYLLLPNAGSSKKKLKEFDEKIKNISQDVYDELNNGYFIRVTRKFNYNLVFIIRMLYKVWCLKYEN